MARPKPAQKDPWKPAPYDKADAMAAKAVKAGNATAEQQQRFAAWLINTCCGMDDLSFRPDSERATAFAEGKRFVALQVWKLMNLNMSVFDDKRKTDG